MSGAVLNWLLGLSRAVKRALQLGADLLLLTLSFVTAVLLGTGSLAPLAAPPVWLAFALPLPVTFFAFIRLGFYRAIIRYVSSRAVLAILSGLALAALIMAAALLVLRAQGGTALPLTVPVIFALVAFVTVGGIRFGFRAFYMRSHSRARIRVVIYGAGQSGRQIAQSLRDGADYNPVAFVDDNPELWAATICGLRVFGPCELGALIRDYGAERLLLAMPSATPAQRARILQKLGPLPVHVQTLPDMDQILRGRVRMGEVTEVPPEDLLGREIVPPDPELMSADISGRVVMVTGGGGSIGAELCRQILCQGPRELVVLDHSEYALYAVVRDLRDMARQRGLAVVITECLLSVLDGAAMERVIRRRRVATIYHSAAYKHVSLVEGNALAGIENNVFGTASCLRAAASAGVRSFILISSDKAVHPAGIMGASKRIAELICQAEARGSPRMRVSIVRFGNVLGSSGSVVPLFRRQIAAGGPLMVTHPEVERYFMTIPEAAQLVIQAGAMARGGEVFLLDMGAPVRIVDLAVQMIRLSGLRPEIVPPGGPPPPPQAGCVQVRFSGLQRGEKLSEELLTGASARPTRHPRIRSASETAPGPAELQSLLAALRSCSASGDEAMLRRVLSLAPIGFAPQESGTAGSPQRAEPEGVRAGAGLTIPRRPVPEEVGLPALAAGG